MLWLQSTCTQRLRLVREGNKQTDTAETEKGRDRQIDTETDRKDRHKKTAKLRGHQYNHICGLWEH